MSCSAFLLGGLMKNKGGVGLFQISQKETFSSLISTKYSVATILALFRKMRFFPLQFGQEDNISGNSTERRVY